MVQAADVTVPIVAFDAGEGAIPNPWVGAASGRGGAGDVPVMMAPSLHMGHADLLRERIDGRPRPRSLVGMMVDSYVRIASYKLQT
jgi:hypothetical protein